VDRFFFGEQSLAEPLGAYPGQLTLCRADVRELDPELFTGIEAVVDLAGISNDPSCELDPEFTRQVNLEGSARVAPFGPGRRRRAFWCSRPPAASTVTARARNSPRASPLSPVSLYAQCKARPSGAFSHFCRETHFSATALRFATVFGVSGRMRFDLAVNVMAKNAYVNRRITVEGAGDSGARSCTCAMSASASATCCQPHASGGGQSLQRGQ